MFCYKTYAYCLHIYGLKLSSFNNPALQHMLYAMLIFNVNIWMNDTLYEYTKVCSPVEWLQFSQNTNGIYGLIYIFYKCKKRIFELWLPFWDQPNVFDNWKTLSSWEVIKPGSKENITY